jgi:putative hydrolase of HD superfamily
LSHSPEVTVDALLAACQLKHVHRAGWQRVGIEQPEDVAAHSWGVAWLVLNLLPAELNLARALSYAVLHDLAEVLVGDITPHDGITTQDKHQREEQAMQSLCAKLPAHLLKTWQCYEAQVDEEAAFVRQLDRLDMALQAAKYASETPTPLDEFIHSAALAIHHPVLTPLLDVLRDRVIAK